eukprot:c43422_g1_i1 orf=236-574(+)
MALSVLASASSIFGFSSSLSNVSDDPKLRLHFPANRPVILRLGYPSVVCGRGDKRTAKGKRSRHSFGNARPKSKSKGRGLPPTPFPPSPPKGDSLGDKEFIEVEVDQNLFLK